MFLLHMQNLSMLPECFAKSLNSYYRYQISAMHYGDISGCYAMHYGEISGCYAMHYGEISGCYAMHYGDISGM